MKKIYIKIMAIVIMPCIMLSSCKKFLDINAPKTSLVNETVFRSNDQATSAVIGLYSAMNNIGYASGSFESITILAGLSADELIGYDSESMLFYENQLTEISAGVNSIYSSSYKSIYTANAILEGLDISSGVTPPVKMQLEGEALFIRAFAYFYLVNLYGEVPLQLNTDYRVTEIASKASVAQVYGQIITDLKAAEERLSDTYPTSGRVRPNKSAAQALLARTYLFLSDWENAEKYASLVIGKNTTYSLVNLNDVFLANSQEAIWQLMPPVNSNTREGSSFILQNTPTLVSLRNSFINDFEESDNRRESWIKSFTNTTGTYYYPFKYKVKSSTTVTEYSMVLRLAEQYLIRAEARINQLNKIEIGIADLNFIRTRARPLPTTNIPNPLPPLSTTLSKSDALLAVEQERKNELFSEWGHRWLDLKRTGNANAVLSLIKPEWRSTNQLYPIPLDERLRNLNIKQNYGY